MLVHEFMNRYILSLIKKINWLISKGMCVLCSFIEVYNECFLVKK